MSARIFLAGRYAIDPQADYFDPAERRVDFVHSFGAGVFLIQAASTGRKLPRIPKRDDIYPVVIDREHQAVEKNPAHPRNYEPFRQKSADLVGDIRKEVHRTDLGTAQN